MNQNQTPLLDAVTSYIETDPAYFRIPGHRLERGISNRWTEHVGSDIFKYDVTETPLTDDLHNPSAAIADAQNLASELYHARKSFFLVNGTTCGNEAMIMSAVGPGEKIMVARNAHKSAMMGLIISGATPVYIMPKVNQDWGIQGGISPEDVERTIQEHPDCKALFLVSPSYYGVCSDLEKIAEICHAHHMLLLVDEAHGGHLYFRKDIDVPIPHGALEQGADMCVQSMHKITGALTQSSVLHIGSDRVSPARVAKNLHIVQSTSPSYLLMTSLDCARYELALHGEEMLQKALLQANALRESIRQIPGMKCMGDEILHHDSVAGLDLTRLVINATDLGLSGYELEQILFQDYHVDMELSDAYNVLAILTYANTESEGERLLHALREISSHYASRNKPPYQIDVLSFPDVPEQLMSPREAYYADTKTILWKDAIGCICGEMLAPYPPGIPVIYPGEMITREIWEYMEWYRKGHHPMHGPSDDTLETIQIIPAGK